MIMLIISSQMLYAYVFRQNIEPLEEPLYFLGPFVWGKLEL
jgi:hypothetical protein